MKNKESFVKGGCTAWVVCLLAMMMVGCKKTEDGEGPSGGNGTDTAAVVKHNVELRYDLNTYEGVENISFDTIRKYNNDADVDTIFMIPDPYTQMATWDIRGVQNAVDYLRERHNVNPDKVFGKGDLLLNGPITDNYPEIVRFFQDTLKYNVVGY